MDIAGYEVDPKSLGFGVLAAIIVLIVMSTVPSTSIVFRILGAVLGFFAGTAYTQFQINKG